MAEQQEPTRPSDDEVKLQLALVERSKAFDRHPKCIDLLKRLVRAALEGEPIIEYELGKELFDKPKGWSPKIESAVRERKSLTKKLLREYYVTEGKADRVRFEFPKRGPIKIFYNHLADAAARVEGAERCLMETFPEVVAKYSRVIVAMLRDCITLYPSYAPAHALLGKVLLTYAACDIPLHFPVRESIAEAEKAAAAAVSLDSKCWLGHIVLGALRCCRFRWEEAAKAFEAAMIIDLVATKQSFFFMAYLIAADRLGEVSECLALRRGRPGPDQFGWKIACLMSYLNNDGMAYGLLCESSTSGPRIELDPAYKRGERILDFDFWPMFALGACIWLQEGDAEIAERYCQAAYGSSHVDAFPGLVALTSCESGRGNMKKLHSIRAWVTRWKQGEILPSWDEPQPIPVTEFSYALAYMGLGNLDEAINRLSNACDEGYPWMVFLHKWPLFDRLRDRREFKVLLDRMNLAELA